MHADWYTGSEYVLDSNGRVNRKIDPEFEQAFPALPEQWLWRDWSNSELNVLLSWGNKNIAIGTHSIDQVRKIKAHLSDRVTTIGVTYGENLYPAVIKNFCTKVGNADPALHLIYQQANPALYAKLKEQNLLGLKVLKDCLSNKTVVPRQQSNEFDIAVDLEHILLGNLGWFNQWLTQAGKEHLSAWLALQDPLYSTAIAANEDYIKCLGVNTQATAQSESIELNAYHNILIQHHYPQAPRFKTHAEFKYFTENTIKDNYKATLEQYT